MGTKELSPFQARKEAERVRNERLAAVLTKHNRIAAKVRDAKRNSRKSAEELCSYLDLGGIWYWAIRPASEYKARSYNLDKQLIGLLNHMFARYPAPRFLYEACIRDRDPNPTDKDLYRKWFASVVLGESFPKRVRGIMTSKEAHLFLQAPNDQRIHENVWWARLVAAEVPKPLARSLVERIFTRHPIEDPKGVLMDMVRFFGRWHEGMNQRTLGAVVDFLTWSLQNEPRFHMKGRTLSSVVKMTHEWHASLGRAKVDRMIMWDGLGLPLWSSVKGEEVWTVHELRTNHELLNEGRDQRHCVYSYTGVCSSGQAAIFSLRRCSPVPVAIREDGSKEWNYRTAKPCVTIEVRARAVVQAKGRMNRLPYREEAAILKRWAGENAIRIDQHWTG